MGKANDGLDIHLTDKERAHLRRLFAMRDVEPSSDKPITNPPTIYDTLRVIRVKNIEEFYACGHLDDLSIKLDQRIYGHIMLHGQDRNLLFDNEKKAKLSPELTEALKSYFASFLSSRKIITFYGANIDDAVREAGHIQFIQEMTKRGPGKIRDLYR